MVSESQLWGRVMKVYLNTKVPTINVVSEKQITRLCRVAADLEQLHEVVVLAMHIATHGDGGIHLKHVWLVA